MIKDNRPNYRAKVEISMESTAGDSWSYYPVAKAERCFSGKFSARDARSHADQIFNAVRDEFRVLVDKHINFLEEEEAKLQAKIDANEVC